MPQGYCLLLVDCDMSLLGLGYLLLLAALLMAQPARGRWQELGPGRTAAATASSGSGNMGGISRRLSIASSVLPDVMRGLLRSIGGLARHAGLNSIALLVRSCLAVCQPWQYDITGIDQMALAA